MPIVAYVIRDAISRNLLSIYGAMYGKSRQLTISFKHLSGSACGSQERLGPIEELEEVREALLPNYFCLYLRIHGAKRWNALVRGKESFVALPSLHPGSSGGESKKI